MQTIRFCAAVFVLGLIGLGSCSKKVVQVVGVPIETTKSDSTVLADTLNLDQHEERVDTVINFSKSGCYGQCPVFNFTIFSNGHVHYHGKRYAQIQGKHHAVLSDSQRSVIDNLVAKANLWDMNDLYPENREMWIVDLPISTTTVKHLQMKKVIQNNHSAPLALQNFETQLIELVESLKFQEVD